MSVVVFVVESRINDFELGNVVDGIIGLVGSGHIKNNSEGRLLW